MAKLVFKKMLDNSLFFRIFNLHFLPLKDVSEKCCLHISKQTNLFCNKIRKEKNREKKLKPVKVK